MSELRYTVNTCATPELNDPLRAEIIALCTLAFNGEDFNRLFEYIPDGVDVLGYLGDQLVSHAILSTRWMQINDGPLLRCAYVDAVATHPDHRRKGYGAAVMRQLAEEMVRLEYQIAGLSTSTPAFYQSVGWEIWRGPLAGRTATGLVETIEEDPVMILRLPVTPSFEIARDRLSIEQQGRIW
jgi:GNAT superfamily N-acetyltransferase